MTEAKHKRACRTPTDRRNGRYLLLHGRREGAQTSRSSLQIELARCYSTAHNVYLLAVKLKTQPTLQLALIKINSLSMRIAINPAKEGRISMLQETLRAADCQERHH